MDEMTLSELYETREELNYALIKSEGSAALDIKEELAQVDSWIMVKESMGKEY